MRVHDDDNIKDSGGECASVSPGKKLNIHISGGVCASVSPGKKLNIHISGGDALRGHTRSHPEHDG